jgi:hypothetical protein
MKRIHFIRTVTVIVLAAAIAPPLALIEAVSSSAAVGPVLTPAPRVWDAGIDGRFYFTPWYDQFIHARARHARWLAHWERRHRYLLRKRYLETKQDQAEARRAPREGRRGPERVLPVSPPASYGSGDPHVDPSTLPYPWSCIMSVETGGYNVWNSGGSGASGYFQFMPGTWQAYCGCPGDAIDYSFNFQYAVAQKTPLDNWQDGC